MATILTEKKWYQSKTIWAVVISVIAGGLAYFTKNPAIEDAVKGESSNITSLISQAIAVVSGVIALIGRITATKKIK